jgi:RNA recognition motif-containing protein
VGTTEDDLRSNINLTSVQRENVWHPYYEVKLEEEDFKEKYQRQRAEKRESEMMNKDIAEIESKLKSLEEKERQEQMQLLEAQNGGDNKKTFNLKSLQDRKREEEKFEQSVPVDDPYTIKLRSLTNDITEEDIAAAMKKFGEIVKVKIPMEELRNGRKRGKGFAFITFATKESASKAISEGEIAVEFATLQIERALKAPPRP